MSVAAPPAPSPDPPAAAAGAEPEAPDSSRSPTRTYHVLEERSLGALVCERLGDDYPSGITPSALFDLLGDETVYDRISTTEARNTEGALRNAAKQLPGRSGEVTLIPVSDRSWHPENVNIRVEQIVTVGR